MKNQSIKKIATSKDMNVGYRLNEKKNKTDFIKAQAKEAENLKKQFGQGDKRNWY